jgi:peptide/nickel transport system substrate-binding protein
MGSNGTIRKLGSLALASGLLVGLIVFATSASTASAATRVKGGTVTFAEPPGASPNYIFPFDPTQNASIDNTNQFQYLMWRPLNWFGNNETAITSDPSLNLYKSVTYSNGGKTVTIVLKPYQWSDGQPVTTRDITFFINLIKAEKSQWSQYSPGEFPDNLASVSTPNATTLVMNLTKAYNDTWFTDNQLGLISPLPQHAWDKTSATGAIGDYDETTSGAQAVFTFLNAQAQDLSTYATNPLWQVVDGPWKLSAFTTSGEATFVPNPNYSGPIKPSISKFIELPFTDNDAEVSVLRSGSSIDIGYLPTGDLGQQGALKSEGYNLVPWENLGVDYAIYDLTSPQVGPIFSQLYVRQAIQHTVDQPEIVKDIFHGYGNPTYGPIPLVPSNPLVSTLERSNPYPFSISDAEQLLKANGWKVVPNGTDSCTKPGSGAGECGAKITKGEQLAFTLLYASGNEDLTRQEEVIKSAAAEAGIQITLKQQPFNDVVSVVDPCPTSCNWEMGQYGGISYSTLPTGDGLFLAGASLNAGSYADPTAAKYIEATLNSNSPTAFFTYENYLAKNLPWMWTPTPAYQLTMIKSNLHGVAPQNGYLQLNPENYYYTN